MLVITLDVEHESAANRKSALHQNAYEEIKNIDDVFATKVRKISVEMIGDNEESVIVFEKEL